MNKTININLAGLFFHIDEDAYNRLQRYLSAVRRSFEGTTGADEIMSDIESRIAELFLERRKNDQAVVSIDHVEEVIAIMGQPEDYEVDEEIFEEQTSNRKSSTYYSANKKLYRDTTNGYVGGVATGLAHYLGIEPVWSIVIWVFLIFMSGGTIVPVYLLLWILVPDAVTTSDRLKMMGKEVNLSNLSGSGRNDFNEVAGNEPGAGHSNIVGQRTKRGSVRFFGALGRVIKGIFKVFLKFVGLIIFIAAIAALMATIISVFTIGFTNLDGLNVIEIADFIVPARYSSWLLVLAFFLAVGIPLFSLAVLGLRILVSNMKPIIMPVKLGLLVIWIVAVIFITVTIINIAASQSYEASYKQTEQINLSKDQVLALSINEDLDNRITTGISLNRNWLQIVEYQDETVLSLDIVRTAIKPSKDSTATIDLIYKARGANFLDAKERAQDIIYNYEVTDSTFTGSDRIILKPGTGLSEYKLDIIYEIPVGMRFKVDFAFKRAYGSWITDNAFENNFELGKTYIMTTQGPECEDCILTDDENNSEKTLDQWQYD